MKKCLFLIVFLFILCGCEEKVSYYCINGELDGSECVLTERKDAYMSCREGYTKVGFVCKERVDATPQVTCPEGYYPSSSVCVSDETVDRKQTLICNTEGISGSIDAKLVNGECEVRVCLEHDEDGACISFDSYIVEPEIKYGDCPKGYEDVYGVCKKYVYGRTNYFCEEGTQNGKYCILDKTVSVTYSCDEGEELMGTECLVTRRVNAQVKGEY
ncbi:MAG: hypothetical protein ACI4WW_04605 [Candidatus Coprovivens sp.]